MSKIVLGARPEFIESKVEFTMPDGSLGVISCKYKYRTRTEFAAFIDETNEKRGATAGEAKTLHDLVVRGVKADAEYLAEALVSWDLDEPLTLKNLEQFADELPAGVVALTNDYRKSINEGRLGN